MIASSASEYAKEIVVMNFTRTQVTDTNQGCRNKNQFTADSKLHCKVCDTDVHVGTSGTSNLNTHQDQLTDSETNEHTPEDNSTS